jgi:hypothetical protein
MGDVLHLLPQLLRIVQQFSETYSPALVEDNGRQWAQLSPCLVVKNFSASAAKKHIAGAYDNAVVVVLEKDEIALLHSGHSSHRRRALQYNSRQATISVWDSSLFNLFVA